MRVEVTFAGDQAEAVSASEAVERALAAVFRQAEETGVALSEVKITSGQASETAVNARRMQNSISGVKEEARQARRELDGLRVSGLGGLQSAAFTVRNVRTLGLLGIAGVGAATSGPAGAAGFAGLAALPGLAATGGAAVGVLAAAFSGLGDAVGGDIDKFNELDAQTQKFVLTIRALIPFAKELQGVARAGLFPGVEDALHSALTPQNAKAIEDATRGVAGALGEVARAWGQSLGSPAFTQGFATVLGAAPAELQDLGDAALHLATGLGRIAVAGSPVAQWLTQTIDLGSQLFDQWTADAQASGRLSSAMAEGRDELIAVAHLIGALLEAVGQLSIALKPLGDELIRDVTASLQDLAGWIEKNRQGISDMTTGALHALEDILNALKGPLETVMGLLKGVVDAVGGWETAFEIIIAGTLASKVLSLAGAFTAMSTEVLAANTSLLTLAGNPLLALLGAGAFAGGYAVGHKLFGGSSATSAAPITTSGTSVNVNTPDGKSFAYDAATGTWSEWTGSKNGKPVETPRTFGQVAGTLGVGTGALRSAVFGAPTFKDIPDRLGNLTTKPTGGTSDQQAVGKGRQRLVQLAQSMLGVPYLWGGSGPNGFDCSGLVMWAFGQEGVNIPHYSGSQFNVGTPVARSNAQAGDVVFTHFDAKGVPQHEGLYVGGGQVIEAPHTGDVVKKISLDAFVAGQKYVIKDIYSSAGISGSTPAAKSPFSTPPAFAPSKIKTTAPAWGLPQTLSNAIGLAGTTRNTVKDDLAADRAALAWAKSQLDGLKPDDLGTAYGLIRSLQDQIHGITQGLKPKISKLPAFKMPTDIQIGKVVKELQDFLKVPFTPPTDLAIQTSVALAIDANIKRQKGVFEDAFRKIAQSALAAFDDEVAKHRTPAEVLLDQMQQAHQDAQLQDQLAAAEKDLADALTPKIDADAIVTNIKAVLGRANLANTIDQVQAGILGGLGVPVDSRDLIKQLQDALTSSTTGVDPDRVAAAQKEVEDAKYSITVAGLEKTAAAERSAYDDQVAAQRTALETMSGNWQVFFDDLHGNINQIPAVWAAALQAMGLGVSASDLTSNPTVASITGRTPGELAGIASAAVNTAATKAAQLAGIERGLHMYATGGIAVRPQAGVFGEAGPEALIPLNDSRARQMLGGGDMPVIELHGDLAALGPYIDVRVRRRDNIKAISLGLGTRTDTRRREGAI